VTLDAIPAQGKNNTTAGKINKVKIIERDNTVF
jgi:hypothetical protein